MSKSLETLINSLSQDFLDEAKNSPQLFTDMAAMENYMAESYGERVFIEMLQNADDAKATAFLVTEKNGHVFIANNGKVFDETDVKSICRSGASEKKRGETIGYRGVGFKSTTHLSSNIYIHSNNCTFSFSKALAAKKLGVLNESLVPTIRIPFLVEFLERDIEDTFESLKAAGYSSIFVFYNAKSDILEKEIDSISADYFIFLRNLKKVDINLGNKQISVKVKKNKENILIELAGRSYLWRLIEGEDSQIAFALNMTEDIIACKKEEAVFHCYLPTYEPSPFLFKINSDFSTDPSRKHITLDIRTENAIKSSAWLLFETLKKAIKEQGSNLINILEIIKQKNTFAKVPRYFEQQFLNLINSEWIEMEDGRLISPSEYIKKSNFLDDVEWNWIRQNTPLSNTIPLVKGEALNALDNYLKDFAKETYSIEAWIKMLSTDSFVSSMPEEILSKLYANILKQIRNKTLITHERFNVSNCLLRYEDNIFKIGLIEKDILIDFVAKLDKYLISGEIEWIRNYFELPNDELQIINNQPVLASGKTNALNFSIDVSSNEKNKVISKWRAAEKQCVEFEEIQGNRAKDVSKQNLGYDVLSVTPNGRERYIEVKSVKARGSKISMTNNEYTAAHIYGDNYFICVVYEDGDKIAFEYIQNPLRNLELEKVVRQWEWLCEGYSGQIFKIEYM